MNTPSQFDAFAGLDDELDFDGSWLERKDGPSTPMADAEAARRRACASAMRPMHDEAGD